MIFKATHQQVLDGTKTQTRRPVKEMDIGVGASREAIKRGEFVAVDYWDTLDTNRLRWKVGKDYAVQPGRGKKAIGRTPPIKVIRRERLQEISLEDIRAEGIRTTKDFARLWDDYISRRWIALAYDALKAGDLRRAFNCVWNSLYRKPYRWEDNPEVWVLEFEPIEDFDEFIMRETEAAIEGGIIDENTGLPFELAEQ